jgi:hypothetical protein
MVIVVFTILYFALNIEWPNIGLKKFEKIPQYIKTSYPINNWIIDGW